MSSVKKTFADGARKMGKNAARQSGRAAASAGKTAMNKAPDFETSSKWFIRVVTQTPQYLKLYLALLTDDRVSHKAKVVLVTAIAALGANLALGGILYIIQTWLSVIIGPFAFLPTILILLITLDICYSLISSSVLEDYEKTIFGGENSLRKDIARLRGFMGSKYDAVKERWVGKAAKVEERMKEEGQVVDGELTDEALQDAADQIVELQTSEKLQKQMDREVRLLESGEETGQKALEDVERKLLEE